MKDIFTKETFYSDLKRNSKGYPILTASDVFVRNCAVHVANIANAKFKEWLEREGVVVYGWHDGKHNIVWREDIKIYDDDPTYKAILVCVESLVKPKCKHEVDGDSNVTLNDRGFICKGCGKYLKPKEWVEVE